MCSNSHGESMHSNILPDDQKMSILTAMSITLHVVDLTQYTCTCHGHIIR